MDEEAEYANMISQKPRHGKIGPFRQDHVGIFKYLKVNKEIEQFQLRHHRIQRRPKKDPHPRHYERCARSSNGEHCGLGGQIRPPFLRQFDDGIKAVPMVPGP